MNTAEFSDRLTTLSDGTLGLRGSLQIEARDPALPSPPPAGENPCLDFIASDDSLDHSGEIIAASGWHLATYQRNPVFQNSHQHGDILFTLGKALTTEVRNGKLVQRIQFATDVNPMAKIAYGLYKGKFLNAVSVGFIPIRWENGTEQSGYRRKFLEQELLEVSAVAIPANPNALALAYKSGAIEKSDLQNTVDLIRGLCDSDLKVRSSKFEVQGSPTPIIPIDPITPISPISPLLQIARDLRNLLRS